MQDVSGVYNPYASVRIIGARVSFELLDVDAALFATVTTNSSAVISNLGQVTDKITLMSNKVATLEPDFWKLDGTFKCYTSAKGETGWWSGIMSDASGDFAEEPYLLFTFENAQDSKSFTIVFDNKSGETVKEFTITTYGAIGEVISSKTISNNTEVLTEVELESREYYSLKLTISKTSNPFRYARVCEFMFGTLKILENMDIASVEVLYEISKYMENFPSAQLVVNINNADKTYNIINPDGIYKYLKSGQGINVIMAINGEDVNMGRFFFNQAITDSNSLLAKITANDKAYFLDDTKFYGGASGTWTVQEAVTAVLSELSEKILTDIPENIAQRIINKCIPLETTLRECLRLIAQASMSFCFFSRQNVLTFCEADTVGVTDELNPDRFPSWPEIKDTGLINRVRITSKDAFSGITNLYVYESVGRYETRKTLEINNPLVNSSDVPKWIFNMSRKSLEYSIKERGNIAREIMDSIKVFDKFNENRNVSVLSERFVFDKALSCEIKAVTGGE